MVTRLNHVLALLLLGRSSNAFFNSEYFVFCDIRTGDNLTLSYNGTVGTYRPTSGRLLEQATAQEISKESRAITFATNRQTQSRTDDILPDFQGRVCSCVDPEFFPEKVFFCPLEYDFCALPRGATNVEPSCLNLSKQDIFARSLWPILMIWIVLGVILLFVSAPGRNARDGLLSFCMPGRNERIVNDLLANRRHFPQVAEAELRPTRLKLKTKRYTQNDEDNTCSICFAGIETGERVGVLSCDHSFHSTCLKGWLTRRNVCPLCLQPDVATPDVPVEGNAHEIESRGD